MKTRITVCIMLLSVIVISCNDNSIKPVYDKASLPDEFKIEMIRIPQNDNYSCATTSLATLITYYRAPRKTSLLSPHFNYSNIIRKKFPENCSENVYRDCIPS